MVLWPVAVNEKRSPISDVDRDLTQVKTHTTTVFDLQPYLMFSYVSEIQGINCDYMPLGDTLRDEVLWSCKSATGILFPCRQVNVITLEVKDFCGVINISRLVQGNSDDVKGLRPECWAIIYDSDRDWHVVEGVSEIREPDIG